MLQVFHVDVAIDQDVASVSKVCCKHLFKNVSFVFRRMFASVSDLDVAYVSHMLQEYVPMILVVSVLCCSKCFHVAVVLSRCCICYTHMFQVYVPNVLFASDVCCIQVFHVSEVCSENHRPRPGLRGIGHDKPGAGGQGVWRAWVLRTATCSSSSRLLGPAHPERGAGSLGRSRGHGDRGGVRVRDRARRSRVGYAGVQTCAFIRTFGH
jgi:hypothetical protein